MMNSVPLLVFEKLSWYESPSFHYTLAGFALLLLTSALFAVPWMALARKRQARETRDGIWARIVPWVLWGVPVLALCVVVPVTSALSDISALSMGRIPLLGLIVASSRGIVVLTAVSSMLLLLAWFKGTYRRWERLYYSIVCLAAIALTWFLNYWHMIAWQF